MTLDSIICIYPINLHIRYISYTIFGSPLIRIQIRKISATAATVGHHYSPSHHHHHHHHYHYYYCYYHRFGRPSRDYRSERGGRDDALSVKGRRDPYATYRESAESFPVMSSDAARLSLLFGRSCRRCSSTRERDAFTDTARPTGSAASSTK